MRAALTAMDQWKRPRGRRECVLQWAFSVYTRGGQPDELQELHFRWQLMQEPFFIETKHLYHIFYPIASLNMALGLQEFEVFRISRQSAHEAGKVVSPRHKSPLPPGDILVFISVRS